MSRTIKNVIKARRKKGNKMSRRSRRRKKRESNANKQKIREGKALARAEEQRTTKEEPKAVPISKARNWNWAKILEAAFWLLMVAIMVIIALDHAEVINLEILDKLDKK
jgi:hypothetical protein